MTVSIISLPEQLPAIREEWDRLTRAELRHFPDFEEFFAEAGSGNQPFRLVISRNEGGVAAMACFVLSQSARSFWIGERKLLSLDLRQAQLLGSAILGNPDAQLAAAMLKPVLAERRVAFIQFGDVARHSGLYQAVRKLGWRWFTHDTDRRATRRLIVFPDSFKAYLAGLRSSTRRAFLRDQRLFQKLNPVFRVMTRPEDMRAFLKDAASIGEKSYQSSFGMSLDASDWRRQQFESRAARGGLFGYVAYVEGKPVAFYWGEVSHEVFNARITGYDPAFRKNCPGTGMLLFVLEDLMNNRICRRFDFGLRDMEYKQGFATDAIDCAQIIAGSYKQPAAVLAVILERLLGSIKPMLLKLVGGQAGLQNLKKRLRRG